MSNLSEFYDFYDGPEQRGDQFDFYSSLFDPDECELLESSWQKRNDFVD
jgi:hypothetical protein